ncbi:hypothetical protein HG531_013530 [Fusarium graminearum]|nr:hypothetical protein HG531_013530 [Fusarium graminearum]
MMVRMLRTRFRVILHHENGHAERGDDVSWGGVGVAESHVDKCTHGNRYQIVGRGYSLIENLLRVVNLDFALVLNTLQPVVAHLVVIAMLTTRLCLLVFLDPFDPVFLDACLLEKSFVKPFLIAHGIPYISNPVATTWRGGGPCLIATTLVAAFRALPLTIKVLETLTTTCGQELFDAVIDGILDPVSVPAKCVVIVLGYILVLVDGRDEILDEYGHQCYGTAVCIDAIDAVGQLLQASGPVLGVAAEVISLEIGPATVGRSSFLAGSFKVACQIDGPVRGAAEVQPLDPTYSFLLSLFSHVRNPVGITVTLCTVDHDVRVRPFVMPPKRRDTFSALTYQLPDLVYLGV